MLLFDWRTMMVITICVCLFSTLQCVCLPHPGYIYMYVCSICVITVSTHVDLPTSAVAGDVS